MPRWRPASPKSRNELAETRRLQEISLRLFGENDIQSLYEQLLDAAPSLMDAKFATMHTLDPGKQQLVRIATRNLKRWGRWGWAGTQTTSRGWRAPDFSI